MSAPLALDLFCGAGGMSIGLEAAGYRTVGFDMWAPAVETHRANGLTAELRDVMSTSDDFWRGYAGRVDLIAGGPPCQPFSAAGKGLGRWDPRDGVPGFVRAVRIVQPRWFLMENVRGLTFRRHADYLRQVLDALEEAGYVVEHRVLSAEEYGVPQTRQRLIILGVRKDQGYGPTWPTPTHRKYRANVPRHEGDPNLLPWVSMAEALGWDDATLVSQYGTGGDASNRGARSTELPAFTVTTKVGNNRWVFDRPSTTIVGSFRPDVVAAPGYRRKGDPPRQHAPGSVSVTEEEAARLQGFPVRVWAAGRTSGASAGARPRTINEPSATITGAATSYVEEGEDGRRLTEEEAARLQGFPAWAHERPARTVTANRGGDGGSNARGRVHLTDAEAAILQAFPRGFVFTGNKSTVYKQIGNAVPPPLAYVIAKANLAGAWAEERSA